MLELMKNVMNMKKIIYTIKYNSGRILDSIVSSLFFMSGRILDSIASSLFFMGMCMAFVFLFITIFVVCAIVSEDNKKAKTCLYKIENNEKTYYIFNEEDIKFYNGYITFRVDDSEINLSNYKITKKKNNEFYKK